MEGFLGTISSGESPETVQTSSHFIPPPNEAPSELAPDPHLGRSKDGYMRKRGRKGHSKSRTGCLNCKRARIKCNENHPSCIYCVQRELRCEWPEVKITQIGAVIRRPTAKVGIPANPSPPATLESMFTMQDFRLFQHFIQTAYPHHPIGNDFVWTHEIPSIACDYDYLLHSMLGLSASDLISQVEDDRCLTTAAIAHRVRAIEALNKAVAKGVTCWQQGNAMLATCFTLLHQSIFLDDGLTDYISFLRGIVAIAIQLSQKKMQFVFIKIFPDEQLKLVEAGLVTAPLIDSNLASAARRSLEEMASLCKNRIEIGIYGLLLNITNNLSISARASYIGMQKVHEMFMMMAQEEFREFTDPRNQACQLLQAHFIAVQIIMRPITQVDWYRNSTAISSDPGSKLGRWLGTLNKRAPAQMLEYYKWTLWVESVVCSRQVEDTIIL